MSEAETTTHRARFMKMRNGRWGIRIDGSAESGEAVEVHKRSGGPVTGEVGRIVWRGEDRNHVDAIVTLAYFTEDRQEERYEEREAREAAQDYEKFLDSNLAD